VIKKVIKLGYKVLIITELQKIITIHKNLTNFPSIFSQFFKNLHQHFSRFLHRFSPKLLDSSWFVLHISSSPTVLVICCKNLQEPRLFIMSSTMANWDFSHVELFWIKLSVAFNFLNLLLHLFLVLARRIIKNRCCHFQGAWIRISPFLKLSYAFERSCIVDHHDMCSFWNDWL
jgi:hypothetical protein